MRCVKKLPPESPLLLLAAAATIDEVMERRLSPQEMGSFA
jgi:hypothetical protein